VEGINIYRTPISPGTWKLSDQYQQLTSGPGMRFTAAVAPDGRILFPSMNIGMNLSVLALDANTGAPSGEPRVITQDSTTKGFPAISWDGSKLAYIAYTGSRAEVRVMELAGGRVTTIAAANPTSPKLSADGSRLAYSDRIQGKQISFLVTDVSAAGKPVCENCLILYHGDTTSNIWQMQLEIR
jgi:Tol biopolymer transport system component